MHGTPVFTPVQRTELRTQLLERAAADPRITAAAITGSAAIGGEDRWSDIDLAFGVDSDLLPVMADWTGHLYKEHKALHHLDIPAGPWIYRVFLLPGTLQVDLAFVPADEFRPLAPTFRLIFGQSEPPRPLPLPATATTIGMGWLYALHARTSIARGQPWQALHMINSLRDAALALASGRHGLPPEHAKGVDRLPASVTAPFFDSVVRSLDTAELARAFQAALRGFESEVFAADPLLAVRLSPTLATLAAT